MHHSELFRGREKGWEGVREGGRGQREGERKKERRDC